MYGLISGVRYPHSKIAVTISHCDFLFFGHQVLKNGTVNFEDFLHFGESFEASLELHCGLCVHQFKNFPFVFGLQLLVLELERLQEMPTVEQMGDAMALLHLVQARDQGSVLIRN